MSATLRLQLLGPLELIADGRRLPLDESRKARALLAYLICHPGPVIREELARLLWAECGESRGRRNLSRELHALTLQLGPCFHGDYHSLAWAPPAELWVDTTVCTGLLEDLRPAPLPAQGQAWLAAAESPTALWQLRATSAPDAAAPLAEAVALYRGKFVADLVPHGCPMFEIWLEQERRRWQGKISAALSALVAYYALQGEGTTALQYVERWRALDPWSEEAQHDGLILLTQAGRRGEALSQYELYCRTLADELQARPSSALSALAERIRLGLAESIAPPAMCRAVGQHAQIIGGPGPAPGTPARAAHLYGRQAELATLAQWVMVDRCRIIALVGLAGTGKTRLVSALSEQVGAQFDQVFQHGVQHVTPLEEVLPAALCFLARPSERAIPASIEGQILRLVELLRRQRTLIILDNLERLFQPGQPAGQYRAGYEAYGQLILRLGATTHQSCLLLVGRQLPREVVRLVGEGRTTRWMLLGELERTGALALLNAAGLTVSDEVGVRLAERCGGNPLCLRVAANVIHDLYAGDGAALARSDTVIFDELATRLAAQMAELPALEQAIIHQLGAAGSPLLLPALEARLPPTHSQAALIEAIRSLQRRAMIDQRALGICLPPLLAEYLAATQHIARHVG